MAEENLGPAAGMDKKAAKKAEKARRKEEKRNRKLAKKEAKKNGTTDEFEEESGGGKAAVVFVTLMIIVIWIAILAVLIHFDVGGFGSTVMQPILKDVPYVNKILPKTEEEETKTKEDSKYPYKTVDEAVAYIKELEKELADAGKVVYDGKEKELMKIGATVLPKFPKDSTDRNRTSPFAFTGNKFEFRMPGSNSSIAGCNIVLNTVIADEIEKFANILEVADDFDTTLHALIKDTIKNHKRIIFNGNGYDDSWVKEAESRGLLNLKTTPDALPYFKTNENIALFERQKVLSKEEVESRYEILMDEYEKQINIEALTMLDIAKKDILPAASKFSKELTDTIANKKAIGIDLTYELETAKKVSEYLAEAYQAMMTLENDVKKLHEIDDFEKSAFYVRDFIIQDMASLRKPCDELEVITSNSDWPFPTYGKLLFGIQ